MPRSSHLLQHTGPLKMAQQAKAKAPLRKFAKYSRQHDEHVLALVKARAEGASLPAIARRFKVGVSTVQMATNAVATADALEASGEDVRSAYW